MQLPLLLAMAAIQQSTPVTLEMRATPLYNAVVKIGKACGRKLSVHPELAGEVVLVKVEGVAADRLLQQLAETTFAEWEPTPDGQRLVRPAALKAALERKEFNARVGAYRKLLDAQAKELATQTTPYQRAEQTVIAMKKLQQQIESQPKGVSLDGPRLAAPGSRLAHQLLIDLGPEAMASVPLYSTREFSNQPNESQRPLGPNAKKLIDEYLETEQFLKEMVGDQPPTAGFGEFFNDIWTSAKKPDGVGKVVFSISRLGRIVSYGASIYTASGDYRTHGFGNTSNLGDNPWLQEQKLIEAAKPRLMPLDNTTAEFYSVGVKEPDIARFNRPLTEQKWSEVEPNVQKLYLNPDTHDPLSLAATDALFKLADESGKPLIGFLSDGVESAARKSVVGKQFDLGRFEALLKYAGMERLESDGWLTFRPTSPITVAESRVSRAALGRYLRKTVEIGQFDFETHCRFWYEAGWPKISSSIERYYRGTIEELGYPPNTHLGGHYPEVLMLLGSMSSGQWAQVLRGGSVRLPPSNAARREMIRGAVTSFDYEFADAEQRPALFRRVGEFLPKGVAPTSEITVSLGTEDAAAFVYRVIEDGKRVEMRWGSLQTAEDMGRSNAYGSMETKEQFRSSLERNSYDFGKIGVFRLLFEPSPAIRGEYRLIDGRYPLKRTLGKDLPKEFLERALESFERHRRQRERDGGS